MGGGGVCPPIVAAIICEQPLSVEAARRSNIKIYEVVNRLNMNLHKDINDYICMGSKKQKKSIKTNLKLRLSFVDKLG